MRSFLYFLVCFLLKISYSRSEEISLLCSDQFCQTYRTSKDCPNIPNACKIQNSTSNGIFLPFPGPCNCCKYCLENVGSGDNCVVGSPGSPPPTTVCGNMLICNGTTDDASCITMNTPCICAQKDYDNRKNTGTLGYMELRPECDRAGHYQPLQCIPGQNCFCVDEDGNRIFGDLPYNPDALSLSQCRCSRNINKISQSLNNNKYSLLRARCLADGNYDPLQCIHRQCICVDKIDGSPIDSKHAPVYVTLSSDLPCFDKNIHVYGSYLKACEKEYNDSLVFIQQVKENGFDGVTNVNFPSCQLDGLFQAIQENETHKFCVTPDGHVMNEYTVDKNTDLAKAMNCYCARSLSIIAGKEKPHCCENGNYEPIQCRRGKCRCVDKNGTQNIQEVNIQDKDKLKCSRTCETV